MQNKSEYAQLKQRLTDEYQAAQRGLNGLATVARHESINKRMEIGAERLLRLVEEGKHEEAQALMNTTWGLEAPKDLPPMLTRDALVEGLQHELEHSEETARLLEHIHTLWDMLDTLAARFGAEAVRQIIQAQSSLHAQSEDAEHTSKERL
jgi:hypothetical protein